MTPLKVIITEHAQKRLQEERQGGVTLEDIQSAAHSIPGRIPSATRFRGLCPGQDVHLIWSQKTQS